MAKTKDRKPGESCPNCGSDFIVDEQQAPDTLIDAKTKNRQNDAKATHFAAAVRAKAEEHGVIHRCPACGYRERFPVKGKAA